jgi:hypothetical protein
MSVTYVFPEATDAIKRRLVAEDNKSRVSSFRRFDVAEGTGTPSSLSSVLGGGGGADDEAEPPPTVPRAMRAARLSIVLRLNMHTSINVGGAGGRRD